MWIDISIILVLCLCSGFGFKKGMLGSIFSIVIFFLSIYLTYSLLPFVTKTVLNIIKVDTLQSTLVQNNDIISFFVNSDNILILFIKRLLHIDETTLLKTVVEFICNIVIFIVLSFIITKILKFIARKIASTVKKMAILGSFDRLCGLFFGFLKGIVYVSIICFIVSGLSDIDAFSPIFSTQIGTSSLYSVFRVGSQQIITTMINMLR